MTCVCLGCDSPQCGSRNAWLDEPYWRERCSKDGLCGADLSDKRPYFMKCKNCGPATPLPPPDPPPGMETVTAAVVAASSTENASAAASQQEVSVLREAVAELRERLAALEVMVAAQAAPRHQ